MRQVLGAFVSVLLLTMWPSADAWADNVSIQRTGDGPLERCDQLRFSFDDEPARRGEQRLTIPFDEARTLSVSTPKHGGVHVQGVEGSTYSIQACKGVPADASPATLDQISVSAQGGRLAIDGPADGKWIVYLIVQAPRAAGIDLDATNGPLTVAGLSGDVRVRSQNGPIKLSDCTGRVDVESQNGPIQYSGQAGTVSITAQNGPLSVLLTGAEWRGTLNARTQNGPVKLALPSTFKSGVQVQSSRNAPWKCAAAACSGGNRTWDEGQLAFTMGTGVPAVRLATTNGPVAIRDSTSRREY
jgi:hypothetical protein